MNAHTNLDRQAVERVDPRAICQWNRTPEARALLASCRENPPKWIVHTLASHERWTRDDETVGYYDRNDERVERLGSISNRAWSEAYIAGAKRADLFDRFPNVDTEIRKAVSRPRLARTHTPHIEGAKHG